MIAIIVQVAYDQRICRSGCPGPGRCGNCVTPCPGFSHSPSLFFLSSLLLLVSKSPACTRSSGPLSKKPKAQVVGSLLAVSFGAARH